MQLTLSGQSTLLPLTGLPPYLPLPTHLLQPPDLLPSAPMDTFAAADKDKKSSPWFVSLSFHSNISPLSFKKANNTYYIWTGGSGFGNYTVLSLKLYFSEI